MSKNSKYIILPLVVFSVLLLDQITKSLVSNYLELYESIEVMDGFLSITYIRNTGAAFGILSKADQSFRQPFFIIFSVTAMIILLILFLKIEATVLKSSFSLIFGGAMGNLIDRIRWGEVIDFIDIHWHSWHWPAFNIADSAISIGVILIVLDSFFRKR